jgi:hypothetical protein
LPESIVKEEMLKGSFITALSIVSLALAVWGFFYVKSVPLNFPETTFVVGVCAVLILVARWALGKLRGAKRPKEKL